MSKVDERCICALDSAVLGPASGSDSELTTITAPTAKNTFYMTAGPLPVWRSLIDKNAARSVDNIDCAQVLDSKWIMVPRFIHLLLFFRFVHFPVI